jgi:hypothetical protein
MSDRNGTKDCYSPVMDPDGPCAGRPEFGRGKGKERKSKTTYESSCSRGSGRQYARHAVRKDHSLSGGVGEQRPEGVPGQRSE